MDLIKALNADLSLEYAAAIQYLQHAACLVKEYTAFAGDLIKHAKDEIKHARKLNDHITFLGGIPTVFVGSIFTASDNVTMLKQDLAGEKTAIERYVERINQARGQGDPGTEAVLMSILKDEQHHATDLESILDV